MISAVSRHGRACSCRYCAGVAAVPPAPNVDTRPRVTYTLPSGEQVRIIVDHDEHAPPTITYQLAGGRIVTAVRSIDHAALLAYAQRTDDIALIASARRALAGCPEAIAWCATQVEMMRLMGERWS